MDGDHFGRPGPRRRSMRRRFLFVCMLLMGMMLALEGACRMFLAWRLHVPPGRPDRVIVSYYPELRAPLLSQIDEHDGWFDVLILGGSVIYDYYGSPALHLKERLEHAGYGPARIWNLSRPAHGSRDSLVKYRWLQDKHFDRVIFYHGINELRYNNVSSREFQPDYSHVEWYAALNRVAPGPGMRNLSAVPAVAGILWTALEKGMGNGFHLHHGEVPPADLLHHGSEIRTVASLEIHLRELATLAAGRNEYLSVATFATCLLESYSDKKLEADRDHLLARRPQQRVLAYAAPRYADFAMPVRIWGDPGNVARGVGIHNQLIRRLGSEGAFEVLDLAASIPCEGENFIDICHLAPSGVDLMVDAILSSMRGTGNGPADGGEGS